MKIYDLIVIGAGPAGLSSAIYAGRSKLDTLVFEKNEIGGNLLNTYEIENYPGTLGKVSGMDLTKSFKEKAEEFGAKILKEEVLKVSKKDDIYLVRTHQNEYYSKSVIVATGSKHKKIGFVNEEKFEGKGISYCATCDGPFFTGLEIMVIGGGDSALTETLFLSKFAKKIYLVYRGSNFRGAKYLADKVFENKKVEIIYDTIPLEAIGDNLLTKMLVKNVKTNEKKEIKVEGCFVFVGISPSIPEIENISLSKSGYINTKSGFKTNLEGLYAVGDIRENSYRQIVMAASEGATAAIEVEKYIK